MRAEAEESRATAEVRLASLQGEVRSLRARQAATSRILQAISTAPSRADRALGMIAESACALCGAYDAVILLKRDDALTVGAHHGPIPVDFTAFPATPGWTAGRALLEKRHVHVFDLPSAADEFPDGAEMARRLGHRTTLSAPMLAGEGNAIGSITLRRLEVNPFSDDEVALLTTFADQAAIAIENARLFEAVQGRTIELQEALEQQVAISAILRVIASSPTDLKAVLSAVAENAARLCDAADAQIFRVDGEMLRLEASFGSMPIQFREEKISRGWVTGRAVVDRRTVHVRDLKRESEDEFPVGRRMQRQHGHRTTLATPLLKQGQVRGAILIRRTEVQPFSDDQIRLLEAFADQAVIAITLAELFDKVETRSRELQRALEYQTATTEVLKVISRSTFDLQPVLDALVKTAAQLCEADGGTITRTVGGRLVRGASYGMSDDFLRVLQHAEVRVDRGTLTGRAMLEGRTVHIENVPLDPEYTWDEAIRVGGFKTGLGVPLMRDGIAVGAMAFTRNEVRPFTKMQLELVEAFADQAVIAINNVEMFEKLEERHRQLSEALEQRTATEEILRVISSSPTDVEPVFQAVAERASRLCQATDAQILRREGDKLHVVASFGPLPLHDDLPLVSRLWVTGRAVTDCKTVHVVDLASPEASAEFPLAEVHRQRYGTRTTLATPLLRGGDALGAILIRRLAVEPFAAREIALLEAFADQAVIAINNAELFAALQERTEELQDALSTLEATSQIQRLTSTSVADAQPVFDAIVRSAVTLCDGLFANVFRYDGELLHFVATAAHGLGPDYLAGLRDKFPMRPDRSQVAGRAVLSGAMISIEDVLADREFNKRFAEILGSRRIAGVPMMRDGRALGVIVVGWREAGPVPKRQQDILKGFADQALIAIENARLFAALEARTRELQQSLAYQTATTEVLQIIARSTSDLEPVLQATLDAAVRLCEAEFGSIFRLVDGVYMLSAAHGMPAPYEAIERAERISAGRATLVGRVALAAKPVHVVDAWSDPTYERREHATLGNVRTMLGVPMLREGVPVGVFALARSRVEAFTPEQVALVTTFADQCVIAIENGRLLKEISDRSDALAQSLSELRLAQDRLVQTEKLASLGQLTAGIAHEIKNPLNFVNNFSALSADLVDELLGLVGAVDMSPEQRAEITDLCDMLRGNLTRVVEHGRRADSIVRNMLLHSRTGKGERHMTDVNALVEESLNLAYHGARAEHPGLTVDLQRDFDVAAGTAEVYPQEITRALLNLIQNGLYAARKRTEKKGEAATLSAATRDLGDRVEIRIRDNGTGIPKDVLEKMFDPFFTTKPAGEGTGLGLSLAHDIIVKQHSGEITVETEEGGFTEFRLVLPRGRGTAGRSGVAP